MLIAPSILSVDQKKLPQVIRELEQANVRMLHLDVMDGQFVKNKTFDAAFIANLKKNTSLIFDTHLMIVNPEASYMEYVDTKSAYVTFHYEATNNVLKLIKDIKAVGVKVGISIKPYVPAEVLEPYLPYLDLILVMSVEPGKGGQTFMMNALDKIKYLNQKRNQKGYFYLIEVDGGINLETAELVSKAGADIVVVGTYLMNHPQMTKAIKSLKAL